MPLPLRKFVMRLDERLSGSKALWVWHGVSFLVVYLLPSMLRLAQLPWALTPEAQVQAWAWATAFLMNALLAIHLGTRRSGVDGLTMLFAAGLCWAFIYGVLATSSDIQVSRGLALLAGVIGSSLAVLPLLLGPQLVRVTAWLAVSCAVIGFSGSRLVDSRRPPDRGNTHSLRTVLVPVTITYLRNRVDVHTSVQGGALAPLGDGFLLVTGSGEFFRLSWQSDSLVLRSERVALDPPMDRTHVAKDPAASTVAPFVAPLLRVTGLVVDSSADGSTVYVAHEFWDPAEGCVTIRVSASPLPAIPVENATRSNWQTLFSSQPCLKPEAGFDQWEGGGRLVRREDGTFLLTLGDYGLNGSAGAATAIQPGSDYGRILLLDRSGHRETLSEGHRNPQGLMVDQQGRIWSTEHGPQGGDEINLIERDAHYGWPFATYGTQYGAFRWPLAGQQTVSRQFSEPVYAFVPAIGISNLIQIREPLLGAWQGDLLVASLNGRSLFRIRITGSRVAYVEPIKVDGRIRDLAEGADGRVVMWTDEQELVVLAPDESQLEGALVYENCSRCHGLVREGSVLGPSLQGIVGREVAARRKFPYSAVFRRLGGRWTEARLDEFLRNPAGFAPGTSMAFTGIADPAERRALIAFLRSE